MSAFKPKYKFRDGFVAKNIDAQIAGEECSRVASTIGLTAENLLNENRAEGTPLHNYFEWRDDVAAEKYRLTQSKDIIRSIVLVRQSDNDTRPPVRQFIAIRKSPSEREFVPIETVLKKPDYTEQMFEQAKRDLLAFRTKYVNLRDYAELSGVFASIDNFLMNRSQ